MRPITPSSFAAVGGFALTDLLLAVAIFGLIMAGAMPLINRASDDNGARAAADELKVFQAAAMEHFKSNRTAYEAAMANGTGASSLCKVGVASDGTGGTTANDTTLHTCAVDVSMLRYLNALPATFKSKNVYGEQWVAIHRLEYASGVPTGSVGTLVVSAAVSTGGAAVPANTRRYQVAKTGSLELGSGGLVVPDTDRETCVAKRATTTYEACGDGFKLNLADYISAASLTTFSNRLPN